MSAKFQTHNLSQNLYAMDSLRVFINKEMTPEQISFCKKYDPEYIPYISWEANKTIACETTSGWGLIQLIVCFSKMDIFIPTPIQDFFKHFMFESLLKYIIATLKTFCTYELANELDFSINFYVLQGTPASVSTWWNIPNIGNAAEKWHWTIRTNVQKMALGATLPGECIRFTMDLKFDSSFGLKDAQWGNNSTLSTGECFGRPNSVWDNKFQTPPQWGASNPSGSGISGFGGFSSPTVGSGAPSKWGSPQLNQPRNGDTFNFSKSTLPTQQASGFKPFNFLN